MNIFRLCGDMSHLFAMLILLMKVWKTRSVSGVSAKSQVNPPLEQRNSSISKILGTLFHGLCNALC